MSIKVIQHPLIEHKMSLLRRNDTSIYQFRELVKEITIFLTYEALKNLETHEYQIDTWQGQITANKISGKKLAVVPILRAGFGMLNGVLEVIPSARVGVVGVYRDKKTLMPIEYYKKFNDDISSRSVLIVDPMLATGNSMKAVIEMVKNEGCKEIKAICIVAAPEGVKNITENHNDVELFTSALDSHLNEDGYIIPGLGDAGDKIFGTK
ncbi:MAG: uracil phosphoribosyltransferase [Candidatus Marinimicrobia bacterium]|nr:uracil phosphoribosyltransferase [Candidatus Neomarinimicrobiota bacterium]